MLPSLYSGFVPFALVMRHEPHGNHCHFTMRRKKMYMGFFMTIAVPHMYDPICVFSPFSNLYLFHSYGTFSDKENLSRGHGEDRES